MPRTCTICRHEQRAEIDQALVSGESYRGIARHFAVSEDAAERHGKAHLPAKIAKAAEAQEAVRADDLLDQVRHLHAKALAVLAQAERQHDGRLALGAIREATNTLRLLGEVLGKLQKGATVNVLITSPEWTAIRTRLIRALEPFPEAQQAVILAISDVGSRG